MKETSVAGESPDKSDKKQSSGKTARNKRDPRLSAFRGEPAEPAKEPGAGTDSKPEKEPEAAAAPKPAAKPESGAKPGSGAKSEPAAGAESVDSSEASGEAGASEASEAPQGGAEGSGGTEGGDDRLRAAVAAWVASSDEEGAEAGDGDGEGAAGDGEASVVPGARDADADRADDVDGDADGAVAKPDAKPEAKSSDVKPDAKSDAKGGAGADAAEVKAADVASSGAGAGKKADGKAAPEAAEKAASKGEATPEAKAKAKAEGDGDGDVDGGRGGVESVPEVESKGGAKAQSGGKAGAESPVAAEVVDQPTAVFKTVGPQKSKSDERVGAAAKADGEGDEDEADESAVDNATRVFAVAKLKGAGAAAGAVDQATTTLKINPPAKATDAVKAKDTGKAEDVAKGKAESQSKAEGNGKTDSKPEGKGKADAKDAAKADPKDAAKADPKGAAKADPKDAAKADGKGDAKADAKAAVAPERDSERTSQFVALKSADDGTAGRSLGKTAPRTPARTADKAVEKPTDEPEGKPADGTAEKAAGKPEGKATGALPAAEPAKPVAPAKPAKSAEPAAAPAKPDERPGAMPPAAAGATAADAAAALPESERTKQQPLPPLDLLAKLTNTPPPPETPLRTVARRFKIWTPLAVLLAIIFVVAQAVRPLPAPTLTVGASTGFTFKGGKLAMPWPDQGQATAEVVGVGSLGTSGQAKPVPTASIAKVMTAYVILRDHPLKKGDSGPLIKVDAQGEADSNKGDESRVPLKKDQQFTQFQMMQMLMIPSGNNVARQLARWDSGSEAAFVKKMNAAAKKLGMTKTTYTDPSGLEKSTVSTAVDQLKLAEQVVKNDVFRQVVSTENVQIQGLPVRLFNNNKLLTTMAGKVRGIKTGSSTPAGGTFMWSGYRTVGGKDQLLLGVTMDQHVNSTDPNAQLDLVLNNTEKVITAARDALVSATVVKKGQVVGYVDDGLGGETPIVATKDLSAVGWSGMKATFSMSDGGKGIPHTAKAGTEVGVLTVGNGESTRKVPVALKQDLVEPTFGAKLVRLG
ncbi:serine hydrolase [Streptomyces decoyicus]